MSLPWIATGVGAVTGILCACAMLLVSTANAMSDNPNDWTAVWPWTLGVCLSAALAILPHFVRL